MLNMDKVTISHHDSSKKGTECSNGKMAYIIESGKLPSQKNIGTNNTNLKENDNGFC
jgi:hypothetical protein